MAYDVSTEPKRRQWNSRARILSLNPKGRRQTKKRGVVKVAWQVAHLLDVRKGWFIGVLFARTAWDGLAAKVGLPNEGEGGQKLIRRSMAKLLRDHGVPREEIEAMLGHRVIDPTDIYAPFDPNYLDGAVSAIEAIIDEIEALAPGSRQRHQAQKRRV